MISYVPQKDIKGITEKLAVKMGEVLPEGQIGPCMPHTLKWSLVTNHQHSSGDVVLISHVGCNLYV